jgi:uncharacterized repeat protein (TIGR01451 family)
MSTYTIWADKEQANRGIFSTVQRGVSAFTLFSLLLSTFAFALPSTAQAVSVPPMCNGLSATVYVQGGLIVGGPNNGQTYFGILNGGNGGDVIVNTNSVGVINGGNGDDTICAASGASSINSGNGADYISVGNGSGSIDSGNGNDTIITGSGPVAYSVNSGSGDDTVFLGTGAGSIDGGSGSDMCTAGNGAYNGNGGYAGVPGAFSISNCEGGVNTSETTLALCTDNLDNDADTLIDLFDPSCSAFKPKVVVNKVVVNDNGGTAVASNFSFKMNGGSSVPFEADASNNVTVAPGAFSVVEDAASGYTASYAGCSGTIAAGETKTCTVTNNDDAPTTGSIKITKYECEAGTTVTRALNGVGGIVPAGCSVESGATFGYVHGTQTDANQPFPELSTPLTAAGTTNGSGILTISDLAATGRYLIAETNGSNQQLPAADILGLYCTGDGDLTGTNDNQELTFVTAGNTVQCIAYNKAPVYPDVTVTIDKFVNGAHATVQNTGAFFSMASSWEAQNIGNGTGSYTLDANDGYHAVTSAMTHGSSYTTHETSPAECTNEYPYKLVGYSTGSTAEEAAANPKSQTAPDFHNLTGDKYVAVWNEGCLPPPPGPQCVPNDAQVIVSDTTTTKDGNPSVAVAPHPAWIASIPGATWIYGEALDGANSSPIGDETFTRTFTIIGTPVDSTLLIAADNYYTVSVNGNPISTGTSATDLDNFSSADTWTIPAADLLSGANTITITVTNPGTNPADNSTFGDPNPGGLLYQLTLNSENCPPPAPESIKVHIYKYVLPGQGAAAQVPDGAGIAPFAMQSTWTAANLNGGIETSGDYTLGTNYGGASLQYAADTDEMSTPADYTTHEVTSTEGPVLPIGAECQEGKYRLVGYRSGTTLENAAVAATSPDAPALIGLNADGYIIVVNEDCDDLPQPPVEPTSSVTMCKLDNHEHPLSGWTLTLKGDSIEDLMVPTNSSSGIDSTNLLANGTSYLATVVGTWLNQGGANPADAEYSTTNGWTTHMDGYDGYQSDILELQINSAFDPNSNWGTYNAAHTYAQSFTGTGAPANFRIFDGSGTTQNESWFGDNSGSLAVNISKGFSGITDAEGCTTFDNVPYGSYTAGEIAQQGWSNVSGLGPVQVEASTETFTIVNKQDVDTDDGDSAPTLTIVKHAIKGDGTFHFSLSGATTMSDISVTTGEPENWATSTPVTLNVGSTTITEAVATGWDYTTSSCVYDNGGVGVAGAGFHEVSVDNGDDIICTFTNTKQEEQAPEIDLSVNKTVSDNTPDQNQSVTYTITAANLSEFAATGVKVTDDLPAGVTFVSASSSVGTYDANTNLWTIGALFSGSSAMLEITASVDADTAGDLISNTATITGDATDPTPGNNSSIASLTVNTPNNDGGGEEPGAQTIVITGDTSAGENLLGWMFNRDPGTQTPFSFLAGNQDIGTGSLFVPPITNTINGSSDKFIGELFMQVPLSTVNSISYRFNIGSTTAADADQFYMSVYITYGESPVTKFYDCRYDVVPSTGIVGGYTTATFDPTVATYVVTTRGGATPSPHACPAAPSGMDALDAGSPSIRAIALNVGDTSASDLGVAGYLDTVVVNTDSMVTTYDFEPVAEQAQAPEDGSPDNGSTSRRNGGGGAFISAPGEVQGAETGPDCSPLLMSYMRLGGDNDSAQVMILQNFLNTEMGTTLSASGIFDAATDAAVRAFQAKYAGEVLPPWGLSSPTGWVYILTEWKINDIVCPGTPKPGVTPFAAGGTGTTAISGKPEGGVAAGVMLDENAVGGQGDASQTAAAASSTQGWFTKFINWLFGK